LSGASGCFVAASAAADASTVTIAIAHGWRRDSPWMVNGVELELELECLLNALCVKSEKALGAKANWDYRSWSACFVLGCHR
jgi:hypothetical protein